MRNPKSTAIALAPAKAGSAGLLEPRLMGFEARDPCPEPRHDYLRLAAWLLALTFGPALTAVAVLIVIWLT